MVYNPEKTNAQNLDSVHIANNIIASFGELWNPPNAQISAAEMTDFETDFSDLNAAVNVAIAAEQNAVGAQMAAFKLVSKRTTRIMKAARSQNLSDEFIGHLTSTAARLRGIRITKKTPDNPATPDVDESEVNISTSRRSYSGILESVGLLIQQLISNKDYKSNDPQYTTTTLSAWLAELQTKHNDALAAKLNLLTARNARNQRIYNDEDGLLERMQWVKDYAETLDLPAGDARVKQLRKLKFTQPRSLR